MANSDHPIVIATRGSALALAQSHGILATCRAAFPSRRFEIKIIKTSGDKLQALPATTAVEPGTKGLFTKELELALLKGEADLAVHSLKDLPTDLPDGLTLAAVTKREDVRDVLIYRDAAFFDTQPPTANASPLRGLPPLATPRDFPSGATIATSSTRRQAQLLALRSDLRLVPIRGNVGTRLRKLAERRDLDGLVLAAAGLHRLHVHISPEGQLSRGEHAAASLDVPAGLRGTYLPLADVLPCVGQGAIGIETRLHDARTASVCEHLNDRETLACVTAERAFLRGMGGGCLSPIAAYAEIAGSRLTLRGVSFRDATARKAEVTGLPHDAAGVGDTLASMLKS